MQTMYFSDSIKKALLTSPQIIPNPLTTPSHSSDLTTMKKVCFGSHKTHGVHNGRKWVLKYVPHPEKAYYCAKNTVFPVL